MPVRDQFTLFQSLHKVTTVKQMGQRFYTTANTPTRIGLSFMCMLLVTSCGESKVTQCNQLIEMVNATEQTLGNITQSSPPDINALQDIADATSQAEAELQTVSLRNQKLNQFKNRFLEFYSNISQDAQTIVTAHNEQNMPDAEAAYQRLEATFQNQEPLVNDINAFCSENYTSN